MQTHPEMFPPDRRNDPKRGAETRVFDELQRSHPPGFVHYEWQRDRRSPQLDFATWLSGVGRFGLQVKGGQYVLLNGQWYLQTGNRLEMKESPLRKTCDATMSLHDEIAENVSYKAFLIPVLIFPDMEPDPAIIAEAERSKAHVIWGVDGLVDRLREIADVTGCTTLPTRRTSPGRWPRSPTDRSSTNPAMPRRLLQTGIRCSRCRESRRIPGWRSPRAASPSSTWTR